MTERRFYLYALLLPLLVPVGAAVVALPALQSSPSSVALPVKVAFFVFLTGVYSTIPYLLFAAAVVLRFRAARQPSYQRTMWLTPIIVAVPFAPLFAATVGSGGGPASFMRACLVGGGWTLLVGYGYVALVQLGRLAVIRAGWLRPASVLTGGES
jgi:hypothetical protein